MQSTKLISALAVAAILSSGSLAKPRPVRRSVVPRAEPATMSPIMPVTDTVPGGMMTPKEVRLRPTTPVEAEANAIWSTRAALNIAALQCQFSPYLATVRNYNEFLRQHADELERARITMVAHFKRYDGTQAQNSFDHYTTQTYNSFSTLDAQYAFCDEAASAGRTTLDVRKGELRQRAGGLRDSIRAALIPVSPLAFIRPAEIMPVELPLG